VVGAVVGMSRGTIGGRLSSAKSCDRAAVENALRSSTRASQPVRSRPKTLRASEAFEAASRAVKVSLSAMSGTVTGDCSR